MNLERMWNPLKEIKESAKEMVAELESKHLIEIVDYALKSTFMIIMFLWILVNIVFVYYAKLYVLAAFINLVLLDGAIFMYHAIKETQKRMNNDK